MAVRASRVLPSHQPDLDRGIPEIDWALLIATVPPSTYSWFREIVDPIAAAALLLLVSPIILVIALLVWWDSGRPVFFRQTRAGRYTQPFTIVKFRTMVQDAPSSSFKVPDKSASITRVGRFLRVSGLDELPNLWNVLRGEMALIGPRPEQYALIGCYERRQHLRHLLKPGITGWWQVHHRDGEPMHLNVDRDIFYLRHQSLALDLKILRRTCRVLMTRP
jgi:lipopolysaccharide/colanic/teichoic acid biosynthesis glycosyltransferase